MPKPDPFVHKLISRLDKLDRKAIEAYVLGLANTVQIYEEAFEHIPDGILILSSQGVILYANSNAAQWLELSPAIPAGRSLLISSLRESEVRTFITNNLSKPFAQSIQEFNLIEPREMTLRVELRLIEGFQEKTNLVILSDITQEKNKSSWREQLARIESLVHLTAGIAHEIGNPLNSISIHLQLLKKELGALPSGTKKIFENTLDILNSETARLDRIIRNFLKVTRQSNTQFRPENLVKILEEAISVMKPELTKNKVKIHLRTDKSFPEFLMDPERLHQSFLNLIKNAMEAMPKGGDLRISLGRKDNVAILRFRDTGIGIKDKDLDHIFDIYYTTKKTGSGLGLMTVFQTIREHGGKIEVVSKVGKGTTFTILFPIRKPKLQLPDLPATARENQ